MKSEKEGKEATWQMGEKEGEFPENEMQRIPQNLGNKINL